MIGAVALGGDLRHAVIKMPALALGQIGRLESKRRVLMMRAMKIPSRKKGPHIKTQRQNRITFPTPAQDDRGPFVRNKKFVDYFATRNGKGPLRPWLKIKALKARASIGVIDAWRIALRRQRELTFGCFDLRVDAVDQNHAPGRRRRGGQQQRMIAPRANTSHRSAGKPAQTISFEPLRFLAFRVDRESHGFNYDSFSGLVKPCSFVMILVIEFFPP